MNGAVIESFACMADKRNQYQAVPLGKEDQNRYQNMHHARTTPTSETPTQEYVGTNQEFKFAQMVC